MKIHHLSHIKKATKDPVFHFQSDALLDNPIWNSLTTNHAPLALGAGRAHDLALRYHADIGPLSAFQELTPELAGHGSRSILRLPEKKLIRFRSHVDSPTPCSTYLQRASTNASKSDPTALSI
jgi:hypothetical protein